jgi:hypothetical protein
VYVNVPEGTTALRVEARQIGGRSISLRALTPEGRTPPAGMGKDYLGRSAGVLWMLRASSRETYDQTFAAPRPGVWQFWITHDDGLPPRSFDAQETSPATPVNATLRVTALSVEAGAESHADRDGRGTVSFKNRFVDVPNAKVATLGIGSERREQPVLNAGAMPTFFDIEVPAGTQRLSAEVALPTNAGPTGSAQVSLGIFYLTGAKDRPVSRISYDTLPGTRKHIDIPNPSPGRYRISLDASGKLPTGGLRVDYRDVLFHPMFGSGTVTDTAATLKPGDRKDAQVQFRIDARPQAPRSLLAEVGLFAQGIGSMEMPPDYSKLAGDADKRGEPPPPVTIETVPVPLAVQRVRID